MTLVDTCGWIEWLTDGPRAHSFAPYLQDPSTLLVPTTVQYELCKWVKREFDEKTALTAVALADDSLVITLTTAIALVAADLSLADDSLVIPLTTATALAAADLSLAHRLAFADAVIYASARHSGVELVTCDDHFAGLPGVTYFPKS